MHWPIPSYTHHAMGSLLRRTQFMLLRALSSVNTRVLRHVLFATLLLQLVLSLVFWALHNSPESDVYDSLPQLLSTASIAYYLSPERDPNAAEPYRNPKEDDPEYAYFRSDSVASLGNARQASWWDTLVGSGASAQAASTTAIEQHKLTTLFKLYEKLKFNTKPYWYDDYTLQDLLTVPVGPRRGETVATVDDIDLYDFEPRVSWSVYIDHMMRNFQEGSKLTVPFSWYDWTDFHDLNKIISLKENHIPCNFFFEGAFDIETLNSIEEEIGEPLFTNDRDKYSQNKWYLFSRKLSTRHIFSVISNHCESLGIKNNRLFRPKFSTGLNITLLFDRVRAEVFQLQTRNALLTSERNPLSITMLSDEDGGETFQVEVEQHARSNMIESGLMHQFLGVSQRNNTDVNMFDDDDDSESDLSSLMRQHAEEQGSHMDDSIGGGHLYKNPGAVVFDHERIYHNFLANETMKSKFRLDIKETDTELFKQDYIYLNAEDFEFDAYKKIEELEQIPEDQISAHNKHYLDSLRNSVRTHPALAPKYFEEPGNIQQFKGMGHHRDKRFFNGEGLIDNRQEYFDRLNAMIRTFQKFTYHNGLISWLGHGTLYGYIYNGQTFPWDNDFDLQMPIVHLNLLAQYFNQTLVMEDPRYGNGRYIVDVGDSITVRVNGNGKNNIDARFIDVDTGLYIDITGLSVSDDISKDSMRSYLEKEAKAVNYTYDRVLRNPDPNTLDKFKEENENFARLNITQLAEYAKEHSEKFDGDTKNAIKKMAKKENEELIKSKTLERGLNPGERYETHKRFKLYNCRNDHFVSLEILSPLVNTMYHSIPTLIPTKYITALQHEYSVPGVYGYATFQGKTYLPDLRYWFKSKLIDKSTNLKGWYPTDVYTPLEHTKSLNDIKFNDLWTVLKNIKGSKEYNNDNIDVLANVYNSFSSSSYRLRELELQYSMNISLPLKKQYLSLLRSEVSSKITSPGKDAVMYKHELALYEKLGKEFNQTVIDKIESAVQDKYIRKYWDLLTDLKYRKLDLFNVSIPESFENMRKDNTTSIDFNKLATPDLFNDPNKKPNNIFNKDPTLDI